MRFENNQNEINKGELKFEFVADEEKVDDDLRFVSSIKNLLILLKDFLGANSSAVYWYNVAKRSFKLLASSEDEQWSNYLDRFNFGNDVVTKQCLNKSSKIIDNVSEIGYDKISCFNNPQNVKSLILNPISIQNEVIGIVISESKAVNFFGNPNLYSLEVFSDNVANFIKFYTLKEDLNYSEKLFNKMSSNVVKNYEDLCQIISEIISRYFDVKHYALISPDEEIYSAEKLHGGDGLTFIKNARKISNKSITKISISENKILVRNVNTINDSNFRFYVEEKFITGSFFCCIPFYLEKRFLGAIALTTDEDIFMKRKSVFEIIKLVRQLLFYFYSLKWVEIASENILNKKLNVFNKRFFESRLASEIKRCQLLDCNDLIVAVTNPDFTAATKEMIEDPNEINKLLSDELRHHFNNYDMIFSIDNNVLGLILISENFDKVYLELEKIRKSISTKIYKLKDKEFNFTISIAVKKFDDLSTNILTFLKGLIEMLDHAKQEGGNLVKI